MADEHLRYWREEGGLRPLVEMTLAVQMLREDRGGETEFLTISWWPSIEAMSAFAGDDPIGGTWEGACLSTNYPAKSAPQHANSGTRPELGGDRGPHETQLTSWRWDR